jgi:hypothetical protein
MWNAGASMSAVKTLGTFVALTLAGVQVASAAEWRYCLSSSHEDRRIFVSERFQTSTSMSMLETNFSDMLDQAHWRHDEIQCPRGDDEQAILVMRQQAVRFNRSVGNEVIDIKWPAQR